MVLSFLGILLLASAASGQNPLPSGNLYGTTLDEQGKSVPGVTVTLRGPGAALIVSTDTRGDFHFLNLSPSAYSVALERTGFEKVIRDVDVGLGKNAILTITMPVAAAAEVVTVRGESTAPDSRKTETGATFERKELDAIPTTRDPWAFLRQVPGVLLDNVNVGGNESAFQSIFVGKGSHFDQNTYNLDGVAITSPGGGTPLYFDFDSLDDIEAVTGGSDPALATPGVALNLVTKRGTNEIKGSGRFFYTTDTRDYGLEAGGPIFKDRLWLWGAGARNEVMTEKTILSTGGTATIGATLDHWNAKLNAQPLPANSLTLFYLHFNKPIDGRAASFYRPPETTWDQRYPSSAYKVEDAQVFTPSLFASVYFSYLDNQFTLTPEGGLDKQADADANGVWHNSYLFYSSRSPQHQTGLTASAFFDTGQLKHELKFGFGYRHTITESLSSWPGDGLIGFEFLNLAAITRNSSLKYQMNYYDSYLSDTIVAGNLTVNAGLRFDYQQGRNLPSTVPHNPVFPEILPALSYGGDSSYPITWRQIEPRVGATYALGRDRKTLLRASYSRFANQLGNEVGLINPFPGAQYLYFGWQDTNGNHRVDRDEVDLADFEGSRNLDPSSAGLPVPVNRIAPGLTPPKTDEIIVGIERELFSDLSASLAYTHRSARKLEFQPLVGTDASSYQFLGNAMGVATDASGFALGFSEPYYGLTTGAVGVEVRNRPDYMETYNGLELQVMKRLSHGWMLRASFSYNDWKKHVGPAAIFNPNNLLGGTNADGGAVVEPSGNNYKSWVFLNSKWQLNISGMVELPLGVRLSANLFGRQGYVIPYSVRVITHDASFSRPVLQIGQVDDFRLPDVYQLDLHLEKPLRIGSKVTVSPSLDCFNSLNRRTVLQRVAAVGTYDADSDPKFEQNPFFNAVDELQGIRTVRVGLRVSF